MKIGLLVPHTQVCGGIRHIIEIGNGLQRLNEEIFLFTPTGQCCTWLENSINSYPISSLNMHTLDILIYILSDQYQIALSSNAKKKIFYALAPEAEYKTPTIPRAALFKTEYLIANSEYTKRYILNNKKGLRDLPVIGCGINPKHFFYNPKIKKEFHVLYYKSPRPWKGSKLIECALDNLKRKYPLKIMQLQNINQKQIASIYNKAMIYVSACQAEGFNLPCLEAMTCGCVVVATDDGGNREYIIKNQNALSVQRTSSSIQKGVLAILADKGLYEDLREEGLYTAKQSRFNWNNLSKKFLDVIK